MTVVVRPVNALLREAEVWLEDGVMKTVLRHWLACIQER